MMKPQMLLMVGFLAASGLSCGENAPPKTDGPNTLSAPAPGAGNTQSISNTPAAPAPNIPKDARWTIYCTVVGGADHVRQANALRNQLAQLSGMPDWYVVQGEGRSTLYYGFYSEISDQVNKREAQRKDKDLAAVVALSNPSNGDRIFRGVHVVALDEADPTAPAEWDLRNARGKWSWEIAVFHGTPDRKDRALEVVRDMRAQGYEAYFYQGEAVSSVYIGVWPEEAIKRQDSAVGRTLNPNDAVMVAPPGIYVPPNLKTPEGRNVVVMQPKVEVQDASLLKVMQQFPEHAENGSVGKQLRVLLVPDGEKKKVTRFLPINSKEGELVPFVNRAYLVVIPNNRTETLQATGAPLAPVIGAEPPPVAADPFRTLHPTPPPAAAGGKLRSLDD